MPYRAPFLAFLIHQRQECAAWPADAMAGREDEQPPPGRLAAPETVSCRAPFLAFLVHQRFAPRWATVASKSEGNNNNNYGSGCANRVAEQGRGLEGRDRQH